MTVGGRIRELRKKRGYTQEMLGEVSETGFAWQSNLKEIDDG